MKRDGTFNPYLHGARGLFSAMVFVYHVYESRLPTFAAVKGSPLEIYLLDSMKFGVELFFGISGLVIIGALTRASSPASFAWDRVTRIFPALWASILIATLMLYFGGRPLPPFGLWAANFLAPPPFFDVPLVHPAAWSLGYEFTFYIICALIWTLRGAGIRSWQWIAVLAGTMLVILFPRCILMAAGVLIAAALPRPAWMDRLANYPFAMLMIFLLAWRGINLIAHDTMRYMSPLAADFGDWLDLIPAILAAGLIGWIALLGIEQGRGWLGRFLTLPFMQWMGTISYSFYLWHPLCMAIVKLAMHKLGLVDTIGPWSQVCFFILALGPALLVAQWSQILLEQRASRWLRRLTKRKPQIEPLIPPVTSVGDGETL